MKIDDLWTDAMVIAGVASVAWGVWEIGGAALVAVWLGLLLLAAGLWRAH